MIKNSIFWLLTGTGLLFYVSKFRETILDDVFINLVYCRNLLNHGVWGFFPDTVTNSVTSPLNILLIAFFGLFTADLTWAVVISSAAELLLLVFVLSKISEHVFGNRLFAFICFAAILINPLIVSTLGLEMIVLILLICGIIYFLFVKPNIYFLSICFGLILVTRMDSILFLIPTLLFVKGNKNKFCFISLCLIIISPWFLFSWYHLGSFIPDTFWLKTQTDVFNGYYYLNGLILYFNRFPLMTALTFACLPLFVLSFMYIRKYNIGEILLYVNTVGLIHFIAYSILGPPAFHWYYAPFVFSTVFSGSMALTFLVSNSVCLTVWKKRLIILLFTCLLSIGIVVHFIQNGKCVLREAPITTNFTSYLEYKEIALYLKEHIRPDEPIRLSGEIGTLAFYSERQIIDHFSDRGWMNLVVFRGRRKAGLAGLFYRINFSWYEFVPINPDFVFSLTGYTFDYPNVYPDMVKVWDIDSGWIGKGKVVLRIEKNSPDSVWKRFGMTNPWKQRRNEKKIYQTKR